MNAAEKQAYKNNLHAMLEGTQGHIDQRAAYLTRHLQSAMPGKDRHLDLLFAVQARLQSAAHVVEEIETEE